MSETQSPAWRDIVTTVPREGLAAMIGIHVNPDLAIIARLGTGHADYRYFVSGWPGEIDNRVSLSLTYVEHLRGIVEASDPARPTRREILFQLEDNPVNVPSASWESRHDWDGIRLIPDLYYFMASGYEGFDPAVGPWKERKPSVVWRGASTGLFHQTESTLDNLPRYRMSRLAAQLGERADVGLTQVAQAASAEEADLISQRLEREGLMKPFVPMTEMARHRFILDIDGNSNSWNFMQKLRLGCCVLRVESQWRQWFSDRLIPWEHYVPVAPDLSDLVERAEWCFSHPGKCEAIAARGTKFAFDMRFADEMSRAAQITFAADDASEHDVNG